MKVLNTYSVCEACLNYIDTGAENLQGLNEQEKKHIARSIKILQERENCFLAATGKDLRFCHYPCDSCGSYLFGNRYEVIGLA